MNNEHFALSISKAVFILAFTGLLIITWACFIFFPLDFLIFLLVAGSFAAVLIAKTEYAALFFLGASIMMRFPGLTEHMDLYQLVLAGAVLSGWVLKKLFLSQVDERERFRPNIMGTPIAALTVLLLIAFMNSPYKSFSVSHLLVPLACFGSFFMFHDLSKNRGFRRKVLLCLLAMGLVAAVAAILQYLIMNFNMFLFLERYLIAESERRAFADESAFSLLAFRSMGTFGHSNLLGMFLAFLVPVVIAQSIYSNNVYLKQLLRGTLVLYLIAIFFTNSRGALLNVAVTISFIACVDIKRIYKILLITALMVVIIFSIFPKEIIEYMRLEEALSHRDVLWKNSLFLFKQRPLTGHGLGMFSIKYLNAFGIPDIYTAVKDMVYYGGAITDTMILPVTSGLTAHNVFLNYAVEMGIFGVLLLIWFYAVYLKWAFLRLGDVKGNRQKAILLGVTAAVAGNFIHSMFEATTLLSVLSIGVPFMALLALAFNVCRE